MDAFTGRRSINIKALTDFSHLEKGVQNHLKKVYSALAIAMLSAATGAYVHVMLRFMQGGLLSVLVSIGLLIYLAVTPHSQENITKRLCILTGFAFFTGLGLGPLMDNVIEINPSIVVTSFMATTMIFVCFSLSALFNTNRQFLYLGGMLFSGLSMMLMLSLLNMFLGSQLIFQINLYLGLAVMCAFVLYDTQLIVEKKRSGDDDFVWHCVDLFLDFINIFRRIMMLLASKEKRRNDD